MTVNCSRPARTSEVFNSPRDEWVAGFVGVENVIEGRVLSIHEGIADIELPAGRKLEAVDNGAAPSSRGAGMHPSGRRRA